jgi:hypothetical protein
VIDEENDLFVKRPSSEINEELSEGSSAIEAQSHYVNASFMELGSTG